jgi:hypothetical protein
MILHTRNVHLSRHYQIVNPRVITRGLSVAYITPYPRDDRSGVVFEQA